MCTPDPPASLVDAGGGPGGGAEQQEQEQEQEEQHPLPGPPHALLACQFGRWWARYRQHALSPAVVIDLTDEEVEFLLQDGVALGDGDAARALPPSAARASDDSSSSSSSEEEEQDEEEEVADWTSRLPRLAAAIAGALASPELAGAPAVVPKLNWSTPWDAAWVLPPAGLLLPPAPEQGGSSASAAAAPTTVSLSELAGGGGSVAVCGNAEQVVLLLQSSDRAAHDLALVARLRAEVRGGGGCAAAAAAAAAAVTPQLALRSWRPLLPERELRLFVAGHRVVGVSQRDPTQRYEQLRAAAAGSGGGGGGRHEQAGGRRMIDALARRACAFHARHIRDTFEVPEYVMDVYVLPDSGNEDDDDEDGVRVVDVNPVAATTSACCFGSWRGVPGGLWASPEYRGYLSAAAGDGEDEDEDGASDAGEEAAAGGRGGGQEEEEEEEEEGRRRRPPPVRFVGDDGAAAAAGGEGGVWPGQRFACGMPFDVLNMSEWAGGATASAGGAADVIVDAMRRAANARGGGGGDEEEDDGDARR